MAQRQLEVVAVFRNTDLTEGRGRNELVGLFANDAVAQQVALGIDVQGTNGRTERIPVHGSFESWLKNATGWERDQHMARLRKLRRQIDELLGDGAP